MFVVVFKWQLPFVHMQNFYGQYQESNYGTDNGTNDGTDDGRMQDGQRTTTGRTDGTAVAVCSAGSKSLCGTGSARLC